jgi:cytosine/uracil/thiamine/allantoin permease
MSSLAGPRFLKRPHPESPQPMSAEPMSPEPMSPEPMSPEPMSAEPMSPRNEQKARVLGLTSATGLVVGSIIGTGVFTMPAVLASAGTSSLIVLAVIAVGATLLAVLFGQLTRRVRRPVRVRPSRVR